jgi:hypothetical protein
LFACIFISCIFIFTRFEYTDSSQKLPIKVTNWDALGYYMYLPAQYIYNDEKKLDWMHRIDSIYAVTGGAMYQANKYKNGNYVGKYLGGISILQLPFFTLAHIYAKHSDFEADGFSAPYQYAVAWGCIFYFLISLFLLRNILLKFYPDIVVSTSLILLCLASNILQYVSIDGGQSHGYIFPMYVFVLYGTIKWHEKQRIIWAFIIGWTVGLATISRPTEAVMIFIPLLWNLHSKESSQAKWKFLRENKSHILSVILGGIIGMLPQLLYWKRVTGSFFYNTGSKWDFLKPHFRVLFGEEKGWFLYTPVTILFILGLFLIRKKQFTKSVVWFCILNIWIVIAWAEWRYGASYSCRALSQSYPIFALPLAGFIQYVINKKWNMIIVISTIYLVSVNLFQIKQYNQGVLHYDEMNIGFYRAIYLNPSPTPLDMSLLDTKEIIRNETLYNAETIVNRDSTCNIQSSYLLYNKTLPPKIGKEYWLKCYLKLQTKINGTDAHIVCSANQRNENKTTKIRVINALSKKDTPNEYSFFIKLKYPQDSATIQLKIEGNEPYKGELSLFKIQSLTSKN